MRHIVAIGGLLPAGNQPLIDYCLKLSGQSCPRLGFIGTASGDADVYRLRFEQLACGLACTPSILPFFARTPDVAAWVGQQDVILVGGGNTKSMLAVWREWGLPELLHQAWENGTVLSGWSAGAICWFDQGVTDSFAERLAALDCLGFLDGSCCPHFSGEPDRRPAYHYLIADNQICGGIAIDDGAGVHFVEGQPHAVVALGPHAAACEVCYVDGCVKESPLSIPHIDLLSAC